MEKDEILIVNPYYKNRGTSRYVSLKIETLSEELKQFHSKMSEAFENINQNESRMTLDEVTINVEVSADGSIGFLGSGAKAGVKSGLTLKFKVK